MRALAKKFSITVVLTVVLSLVLIPSALASTMYRGDAWSTYEDCCSIQLSIVSSTLFYNDDGSGVWGNSYSAYCDNYWDGWSTDWCHATWSGYVYGSQAYLETDGQFHWINGSYSHWHKAQFDGYPAGGWDYWCDWSGSTVPGGKWTCHGSQVQ